MSLKFIDKKFFKTVLYLGTILFSSMTFQNCSGFNTLQFSSQSLTAQDSAIFNSLSVPPLRPLSAREIRNSLKVIFGIELQSFSEIVGSAYEPFDNTVSNHQINIAIISQLNEAAIKVSDEFVGNPTLLKNFFSCSTDGIFNADCFQSFIKRIGMTFFRRPLSDQELSDYLELGLTSATQLPSQGMKEAARVVIRAFIQDPLFTYRWEIGNPIASTGTSIQTLNQFELASRISYFLTGAGPSEEFLKMAENGELNDMNKLRAQVTKIVSSPEFENHVATFFSAWLGYVGFKNSLSSSSLMVFDESDTLVRKVLFEGSGNWKEIFQSTRTFISDSMAQAYGMPLSGQTGKSWRTYNQPDQIGILSHLSFLGRWEKFGDTSPTQRGYHIHKRLFCGASAPPPMGVDVDKQPGEGLNSTCKHDKYLGSVLKRGTSCFNCHQNMDNIGFGLENHSINGSYRTTDLGQPSCIIDGQGEVTNLGSFIGIKGLVALGLSSGRFQSCLVEHWLEFGFGRILDDQRYALVEKNSKLLEQHPTFSKFAIEMALSEEMKIRRGDY